MMEILVFTLNAIVIYLLADWIIRVFEKRKGEVLKQRQAVFFVIFLALALISFRVLQTLLAA
jgi:predicted PurR-regulated permease PerM